MENRIPKEERSAYLETLPLHALRKIGQTVGVKAPTSLRVADLKEAILAIEYGEATPHFTNRGRKKKEPLSFGERENYFRTNPLSKEAEAHMQSSVFAAAGDSATIMEGDYEGFLEKDGASYRLSRALFGDSRTLSISETLVKDCGLKEGDLVRTTSFRTKEGASFAGGVIAVNGRTEEELSRRKTFEEDTPLYPCHPLPLSASGAGDTEALIDLFAPIGKGSRAAFFAKQGKTLLSMFQRVAKALQKRGCRLVVYMVDQRPEDVVAFSEGVDCRLLQAGYHCTEEEHVRLTETAFAHCKRLVESGEDVIFMVHSATRIAHAYQTVQGSETAAVRSLKKLLGAAHNSKWEGSLTILTTVKESDHPIDLLLKEELTDFCNMTALFDEECPTFLSLPESGTENAELLIGEGDVRLAEKVKRALRMCQNAAPVQAILQRSCCAQQLKDELEQWLKTN